jgi:hypothetical protein
MEHQLNLPYRNNTAFVLGNGTSRLKLILENLKKNAVVYACNAIYREFDPDHLIAVDTKMINEIVNSGYHNLHSVWTNPNRSVKNIESINLFNTHKGWSSGPTALWLASETAYNEIYIFGFDFQGIQGKLNNVYADTENYKTSSQPATYFGNWLNQTHTVIKDNPHIQYFRVINADNYIPDKLSNLSNLTHIRYEEFKIKFPECI